MQAFVLVPSKGFWLSQSIVCADTDIHSLSFFSTIFAAGLYKDFQKVIVDISKCMTDEDGSVRQAAVTGLLALAKHSMCKCEPLSMFDFFSFKFVAESHDELRKVTSDIVKCLEDKDPYVRRAVITGLLGLADHGTS